MFLLVSVVNATDLTSPESALASLETAYQEKDIEAAVAAKNFVAEARMMLQTINAKMASDDSVVAKTAETLELAFRQEIRDNGFPDFEGLKCSVANRVEVASDVVKLTEVCLYPDGGKSRQELFVAKNGSSWGVAGLAK
jgi:hypothetical protein